MVPSELGSPRTIGLLQRIRFSVAVVRLIQASWLILFIGTLALVVVMTPTVYDDFQTTCPDQLCEPLTQPNEQTLEQLERLGINLQHYAAAMVTVEWLFVLLCAALGAIIIWKRTRDPIGLILAFSLLVVGSNSFLRALDRTDQVNDLLVRTAMLVAWGSLPLFIALFPDGRWVPSWTRWVVALEISLSAYEAFSDPPRPWLLDGLIGIRSLVVFGCLLGAQIYRYRRVSTDIQRQQTKWLLLAVGILVVTLASVAVTFTIGVAGRYQLLILTAVYGGEVLILVAISLAILRYRLFDIDIIINRALVYGGLTASVVGIYALIVGGLGTLLRTQSAPISFMAAAALAVAFHPLRARLQRDVNRLMYGDRDDPYTVLAQLGQRLDASINPQTVLPTIAETVAATLRLPYVAIELEQGADSTLVAAAGARPVAPLDATTLTFQGERVGQLLVAPRPGETGLSGVDRRLLADVARHAGVAAHAVRLTLELQRSRAQLVATREEERRRLRRDLHDGLGPALASQLLTIDTAALLLDRAPRAAAKLLDEAKAQSQSAVQEIRRVAYALRPPALDDLGLVGALRESASHYHGNGIAITISAPEPLPSLPAAIEVAVYRIAQEALTNVVRHAQANHCWVTIEIDDQLTVMVVDNGVGIRDTRRAGVGLTSMRERAEELGGTCVVDTNASGGTKVEARLPLPPLQHGK